MADMSVLSVNVADAIRFLRALDPRPEARFDLCTLPEVNAKTFLGAELDGEGFARWIRENNETLNVHLTVNEARAGTPRDIRLKAEHIGRHRAFFVDVDFHKNEPGDPERRSDLLADWATSDLPPTRVMDSGHGLWAFWLLVEPVTVESIDGKAQVCALVERYGGDKSGTDLPRLTRLAGTVNHKFGQKRLARLLPMEGPQATPAELAAWCPPIEQAPERSASAPADVEAVAGLEYRSQRATRFLLHEAPASVEHSEYGGDNALFETVCGLKERAIPKPLAFEMLCDVYNPFRCEPPWPASTLREKINRVWDDPKKVWGAKVQVDPELEYADETAAVSNAYDPLHPPGLPRLCAVSTAAIAGIRGRDWVVGKFLARGFLAALGAPPGSGKTQLLAKIALAAATGRGDILGPGFEAHERVRVFMWNQEDEQEEMLRRVGAEMQHYGISDDDLQLDGKPGIVIGSGAEFPLLVSKPGADGLMTDTREAKRLTEYLKKEGFGLAMFDPFAEMHAASDEADNVQIGEAARAFRRIAVGAGIASLLAAHTRKPSNASSESHAGSMDALRGASALAGVCRMIATLFELDSKTAKEFGIRDEDRHRYVRFDDAKANMSLKRGAPLFFQREGVRLRTADGKFEDVGVLLPKQLTKVAKERADGDTLVEDVKALLAGGGLWIGDLAGQLRHLPMYRDLTDVTTKQRLRRAFAPKEDEGNAKNTNGILYETRSRPRVGGKHGWLELQDFTT